MFSSKYLYIYYAAAQVSCCYSSLIRMTNSNSEENILEIIAMDKDSMFSAALVAIPGKRQKAVGYVVARI